MQLLIFAVAAGAALMIALFVLKGAVKLFLPQRVGSSIDVGFDRGLRFVGRWIGRAYVLGAVALGLYIWWTSTHGG